MPGPTTCYLIDGHYRLYKAFFAVRGLSTPDGRPVSAVYGFTSSLLKLFRDAKPDYVAVCFDRPGKTFRHELFEAYKATRKPTPDDFRLQEPMMDRVLDAMGITRIAVDGYEADDVMGTLCRRWAHDGMHVYLVTNDKDAKQLLGPNISMFDLDNFKPWTADDLRAETGLTPPQVIDLLALTGDTFDNVPGVPKVGEKTALPLILEYGSLQGVLDHLDEVADNPRLEIRGKASVAERIREHAEQARLSRELVTINCDAPVEIELEAIRAREFVPRKILPVFQEYGFTNFTRDLGLIAVDPEEARRRYHVVATDKELAAVLKALKKAKRLSLFVVSSDRAQPMTADLVGLGLAIEEGSGWYLPFTGPGSKPPQGQLFADPEPAGTLDRAATLAGLRPFFEDEKLPKVGHDLNHDLIVLRNHGADLCGVATDTMVGAWLLHAGRADLTPGHLAVEFLGRELIPPESVFGSGKTVKSPGEAPIADLAVLAAERADVLLGLQQVLDERLAEANLTTLEQEWELPLIDVLVEMERRGIAIDLDLLGEMKGELEEASDRLEADIYEAAGKTFNIRSPKQLAEILFDEAPRFYEPVKKTKAGPSTDESVLETLAKRHPEDALPSKILDYREVHRLLSTYVAALPKYVNEQTKRVHTTYSQCVTPTGRLTSSEPNLQNIPIRTEFGRRIRRAFIPGAPDHVLLALDYSQVELRLAAHLANDETMLAAFARNEDIHRAVAARVNGVAEGLVTPQMRNEAKAINFGIIYGVTEFGLSDTLGCSRREARAFIDNYFQTFPAIRAYIDRTIASAHQSGFVTTLLGRRRYLPELQSSNRIRRERAEREAVNTTVQGSAADLIKIAMVRLHRRIHEEQRPLRMLLQIHDELVFEVPANQADEQAQFAREVMEGAMELSVKLRVDIGQGPNLQDAK